MKSIVKKLSVVNRGKQALNETAIDKVINRYVAKMQAKGWEVFKIFAGDDFLKYTSFVHMSK